MEIIFMACRELFQPMKYEKKKNLRDIQSQGHGIIQNLSSAH
jgi:hypothetical protein